MVVSGATDVRFFITAGVGGNGGIRDHRMDCGGKNMTPLTLLAFSLNKPTKVGASTSEVIGIQVEVRLFIFFVF